MTDPRDPRDPRNTQGLPPPADPTAVPPPPEGATLEEWPALTEPTAGVPVQPVARPTPGARMRWGVALLVSAAVIGASALGVFVLTGQSAGSSLVGYVAAEPVVYAELRLDLPGDQRQKLGEFLSHFPGFDDQSILDRKLDEALDRMVGNATSGSHNYSSEIKPWFGGELGLSLSRLPDLGFDAQDATDPGGFLLLASVTDGPKALAWVRGLAADMPSTTGTYNGVQLSTLGEGDDEGAYGVHGSVLLLGDEASVKAAIDTNGSGGFAGGEAFTRASGAVPADHLALMYVNLRAYMDWTLNLAQGLDGGSPAPASCLFDQLPPWVVATVRADGEAIVGRSAQPHTAVLGLQNGRSTIVDNLPASTIALFEYREIGGTLKTLLDAYKCDPTMAEAITQIDQALGFLGGRDVALGWIGDLDVVVTREGSSVGGGIVVEANDRAAAERLFTSLRNLAALGGAAGIEISDEPYAGTTITTIGVTGLADAFGGSGLEMPPGGQLKIAYALTGELLVIGVGDAFVKAVLDTGESGSLAASDRYREMAARVEAENAGFGYLDITAVRELLEDTMATDAEAMSMYAEMKPYLAPFDALVFNATSSSEFDRGAIVVVTK